MKSSVFIKLLVLIFISSMSSYAHAQDEFPQFTVDGLELLKSSELAVVYAHPEADLGQYSKIYLLDTNVSFKKNWQRNYNDETASLMDRISDKDMKNIRDKLAQEFNKVFTEVLTKGGHQMVTEGGSGVLIIQPAIVNLEVTAPDTMSPGETTISANAGQMTLYMQLHDGKTGDIIARVMDPEAMGGSFAMIRNSVTNMADADRVLRRWATILNDQLETASAASSAKK